MGQRKLIGEIMVSLGYVSLEQINEARRSQMDNSSKRLGECLMDLGYISSEEINRALEIQNVE
jgi:type IV pilus assembly protein PilB